MNKENMAVLTNIIGAVESGGQVYGRRDYAAYAAPYTNSSLEHTITLGWAQNYGSEAKTLIQMIYDADTAAFKQLDTAGIASMLSKDLVALKWNPTAAQKKVLIALIDSEVGHTCQDALFAKLMETFIAACEQTYTTDIKAVMMYCEIRHLGGKSAADRIFGRLGGDYSLDAIMASLARDQQDKSSDNQVGDTKFWSRHVKCYQFISQYAVAETTETTAETPEKEVEKEVLMAAEITPAKVIAIAEAEIGYLEKKSNSQLDDKTANAGSNNYTKYGRDLMKWIPEAGDTYGIDYQWCDQFVDWCFVVAFGKETALKLLGGWSAYTPVSADYFKKRNLWYTTKPQAGDVIFFQNSTRICHTGIVWKVSGNTVYTIEGNTSGASGVISNGGGVRKKSYTIGDSYIAGYGRPPYDTVESAAETSTAATGAAESTTGGIYMFKVDRVYQGCQGASVLLLQRLLRALGYKGTSSVLALDGDAGNSTITALRAYQRDAGLKVDGDAGSATWGKLLAGLETQ